MIRHQQLLLLEALVPFTELNLGFVSQNDQLHSQENGRRNGMHISGFHHKRNAHQVGQCKEQHLTASNKLNITWIQIKLKSYKKNSCFKNKKLEGQQIKV